MRTFNPHQIIVEYAGEIITQEECDRRMNNEYKNNKVSNLSLCNFYKISLAIESLLYGGAANEEVVLLPYDLS